jgi:hypothetical protein
VDHVFLRRTETPLSSDAEVRFRVQDGHLSEMHVESRGLPFGIPDHFDVVDVCLGQMSFFDHAAGCGNRW